MDAFQRYRRVQEERGDNMTKREFLDTVFALAPNEANKIMDAFDKYVDSNEPHWIPVTEKLPGIGEPVLDESLSVNWMSYKSGGKEWVFPRDVKAWIPLPDEPYKGG